MEKGLMNILEQNAKQMMVLYSFVLDVMNMKLYLKK
jgi:hypothetical protein